ncbi:AAA family ATPase [Paenibacillus sp. FSL R5-0486]|uniref:ATP-dependent nuclease n=1 Tax=Paenibacillus sp. FSL R5-0486 TaxID=2921645 RepID=UPI0030D75AC8
MLIEWIKIKGLRNFGDERINFSNQTLIIGANDVGKSNLIFALRILFDRGLSDRDLDLLDSDYNVYTKANSIEITVKISNVTEDCLISTFKGDIQNGTVYVQYRNSKNGEFSTYSGHSVDALELKSPRFYIKRLNMECVNSNRNLSSFIKREKNQILENAKSQLSAELAEEDKISIDKLKVVLNDVSSGVDELNYIKKSLASVNQELKDLAIHNENQDLSFKNANSDVKTMLENLELTYASEGETLTLGGDGRNNQIFLATWVTKQKSKITLERVTFFAIEEPEAHLHPHQQRKLSSYLLDNFKEQVFITTHSPHIAADFRPDKIVKLKTHNKKTSAANGGCSEDISLKFDDFGYRLDAITSDIFFVNAVFLVEGPSEKLFYTAVSKKMNIDLDRLNASIISVNGVGFKPYIKICQALDIPFVFRTDNDIFSKKKTIGTKTQEFSFQAGVSRIMGIFKEVLDKNENAVLLEYWGKNESYNEWPKESKIPQKAVDILKHITQEVEKKNIYLSHKDLENDLVESNLYRNLKSFYNTRAKSSTVKIMQKAKAENMFEFLKNNYDALDCLEKDDIVKPLKKIKELAEKVVKENG